MAADPYGRFRGTRRPPAGEETPRELRLYGLNAVRAAFARRPEALRKLYLAEARIPALQPQLPLLPATPLHLRSLQPF